MLTLFMSISFLIFLSLFLSWPIMVFLLILTITYSYKYMLFAFSSIHFCSSNLYMDNLSMVLIILSMWISMLMIMASFSFSSSKSSKLFLFLLFILMYFLVLCFSMSKTIFFYIMFEASLIPTLFLILIWGYQPERIFASSYMIMYTVVASLPLLLNFLWMKTFTAHMMFYTQISLNFMTSWFMILSWCFMILAFLVKLPLFMLHLWLPKAHVEAPLSGSMILAAILLKLGGFGFMRLSFMLPSMNKYIQNYLSPIAIFGAMMASIICIRQIDMKSLIAYSSVSHMGMFLVGVLTHFTIGWNGAVLMMIAHGLSSSLLFCLASMTYEFSSSRSLILSKGILEYAPIFSLFWFLGVMMNMAAPPFLNLPSEILLSTSIISFSASMMPIIIILLFLSALYSLILYSTNNHGPLLLNSNPTTYLPFRQKSTLMLHLTPGIFFILTTSIFLN